MSKTYEDTTVLIPTLNEEKSIGVLIERINKLYPKIFITVVDDGSKDKTREIVQALSKKNKQVKLIDREKAKVKGLTISALDGIRSVKTDYALIIDGDLQHPPEKIQVIVRNLRKDSDLVIGYRKEIAVDWPLHRRIITYTGLGLARFRLIVTGSPTCKDILSGYFGFNMKKILPVIKKNKHLFEDEGYKILFDLLKRLDYKTTKVTNFPFVFDIRREGKSKLTTKVMLKYLYSIFRR